ncbi:MAG: LamG-like jellyroll fold domain-containing protein [Pirellulaceae bacterium]
MVSSVIFSGSFDIALVQYNADGTLDTSFGGGDGIANSGIAGTDEGNSVAVQSDGKILVAGSDNSNFLLARFLSDGSLDTSYGTSGMVSTDFAGGTDKAHSMTLQADGKVLLGGLTFTGTSFDFGVARSHTDGTLDTSFNSTGKVSIDLGANSNDTGYAITTQTDGKILLSGWTDAGGGNDFGLVRLNSNGSLDTSFNGTGKVVTPIGSGSDLGVSVTVQSDGKILVAGQSNTAGNNFAAVRYHSDGSLDTTFGGTGKVDTNFGGSSDDRGAAVLVQSDGKILVAGTSTINGNYDFAIGRYNTDGSLDARFNTTNTLGGTAAYTEGGSPVVLDSDVSIFDAELSAANSFNGATLTLARDGVANDEDLFSATGLLGTLTQGGNLVYNGTTIGTVTTNSAGSLVLTFNSNATQTLVNSTLRSIAYANSSDTPPTSAQIDWTFSDGNSGAQGSGGSLETNGSTTVNITSVNDAPVVITNSDFDDAGNQVINFEGGDDSILLTGLPVNTAAGTDVTVEFWMHWDGTESTMPFGFQGYDLYFASGSLGFNTGSGDIYGIASSGLSGGWHHVAAVFHNGDVTGSRLVIDGVEQALTQRLGTPNSGSAFATNNASISGWGVNSSYKLDGQIDEVRIWNGARDVNAIRANMNKELSGVHPGLVAAYSFNNATTGAGGVIDNSGNGHHGTMVGMTAANVAAASGFTDIGDQTVGENNLVKLSVAAYDPDNDAITYTWTQTSGTMVTLSSSTDAQPTFTAPNRSANYQLTFDVAVSDGMLTTTESVTINVTASNVAPSIDLDANNDSGASGSNYVTFFTEGGGPVAVSNFVDATIVDPDLEDLVSLTITITNPLDGANEILAADTTGTSITLVTTVALAC